MLLFDQVMLLFDQTLLLCLLHLLLLWLLLLQLCNCCCAVQLQCLLCCMARTHL
jgi:hypothetical protein